MFAEDWGVGIKRTLTWISNHTLGLVHDLNGRCLEDVIKIRNISSNDMISQCFHHHHHHHQSLNCKGRLGNTDDFQPVFSIFPCSPLPSGTWRTPGLSIPWWCLPTSSSVCLVFFPLSLCLARWFWPDLTKHDYTTAVCVSLRSSGGLRVVRLPAGSWHGLPCW